jgi:hypothetical protein
MNFPFEPDKIDMSKQCVNWKTVQITNIQGKEFTSRFPDIVDATCNGELLSQILTMKEKNPISFVEAIKMAQEKRSEAFLAHRIGHKPGEYLWYSRHFVEWISDLGYHIELSGDEFEPYIISERLL